MKIGTMIRREREACGWTLADLSAATGIAVSNLSRLECGGARDPKYSTLARIASALNADVAFVPRETVISMTELRERASEARDTVLRAGLGHSDPHSRLERKAQAGQDVSSEMARLTALAAH